MNVNGFEVLNQSADAAAAHLLGCVLERNFNGQILRVRIVETEAYDQTDAASHSYRPATERTEVMFGEPGRLYVYFTYGMHYCCNVVVGPPGFGAAVLIRAVEPLAGKSIMTKLRHGRASFMLTNGPAKLCQALYIDKSLNGHFLTEEPLRLIIQQPLPSRQIVCSKRIGISKNKDVLRRFYIKDNPYVSG